MYRLILISVLLISIILPATPSACAYDATTIGTPTTLSAGGWFTAAVDGNGSLWTWGSNIAGSLGNGTIENSAVPIKIMTNVTSVSAGYDHATAIKTDGSLWIWGNHAYGTLDTDSSHDLGIHSSQSILPTKILDKVAAVSAGDYFTLCIREDQSLWAWGYNAWGQLGNGTTIDTTRPVEIMEDIVSVSAGTDHAVAVKKDHSLWVWGGNTEGQLGNGTSMNSLVPIKVMEDVLVAYAGNQTTAAIKMDGSLWMWGNGQYGQLGVDNIKDDPRYSTPIWIMDDVVSVSLGSSHTTAIKQDGSLWIWGTNIHGQLGSICPILTDTGSNIVSAMHKTPIKIMDDVSCVSTGSAHIIAKRVDGSLWSWGDNWYGQLGMSDSSYASTSPQLNPSRIYELTLSSTKTAVRRTRQVLVNGLSYQLDTYTTADSMGNMAHYVRLRDVAALLDGTALQFHVDWDNQTIFITSHSPYSTNTGREPAPLLAPSIHYRVNNSSVRIDGVEKQWKGIIATDQWGGTHTYYKLRDLGEALGFTVSWDSVVKMVVLTT